MSQVVQSTCPGCKATLRIPAEWLTQSFRCKHCGTVIHARAKAAPAKGPPPVPKAVKASVPVARPAPPPVARPARPPSANGDPFAFDDGPPPPPRRYRRRSNRLWVGLAVLLVLGGGFLTGALFAWPHIKPLLNPPPTTAPPEVVKGGDPDEVPLPPALEGAVRPEGMNRRLPRPPRGTLPRRALIVSVNNYLFASPVEHVEPQVRGGSGSSFFDRLAQGLQIPRDQIAELSDAAPRGPKPTVEPVLKETIATFLATARPQDRIVLLLVGHVVEDGGEAFLVPQDGDPDDKATLLPFAWIYKALETCPARQKLLIVDTCRLDPARGQERGGSGPMGDKLDALLAAPPAGVQVWSACVKGQFSYEYDDSERRNGAFLDALYAALGMLDRAEATDPIPVDALVEDVNRRLKKSLGPAGREQTSRAAGSEAADGAAPDPIAAGPPPVRVADVKPGTVADVKIVRDLMKDVSFAPLKIGKDVAALDAAALPGFRPDALKPYLLDDKEATPLRDAVVKARDVLVQLTKGGELRDGFRAPANETAFKTEVEKYQKAASKVFVALEEASSMLEEAKEHRAAETKRWQANYDYVKARLKAQTAYLLEYQAVLGSLRKELPPRDPATQGGWRLASQPDPRADGSAKKLAAEARKLLAKIAEDHAGTPWAVLAKRDRASALGLEWQATK